MRCRHIIAFSLLEKIDCATDTPIRVRRVPKVRCDDSLTLENSITTQEQAARLHIWMAENFSSTLSDIHILFIYFTSQEEWKNANFGWQSLSKCKRNKDTANKVKEEKIMKMDRKVYSNIQQSAVNSHGIGRLVLLCTTIRDSGKNRRPFTLNWQTPNEYFICILRVVSRRWQEREEKNGRKTIHAHAHRTRGECGH